MLRVKLANRGAISLGQDRLRRLPGRPKDRWVRVASLDEATRLCRAYLSENDLLPEQWLGGFVAFETTPIAYVDGLGRLWNAHPDADGPRRRLAPDVPLESLLSASMPHGSVIAS